MCVFNLLVSQTVYFELKFYAGLAVVVPFRARVAYQDKTCQYYAG